jgi:iron complex transport system ATP-binding protein
MSELLKVEKLFFSYGRGDVVNDVSLSLKKGTIMSLLGPNGCGKTTLVKMVLGLLKPREGQIIASGKNMTRASHRERARHFSYVPQLHHANVSFPVMDMVLMGRTAYEGCIRRYSDDDYAAAEKALDQMHLTDLADRSFAELSGGQRQMVLIARTLAQQAPVCIMDEPESGLDYGNQVKLFRLLRELSSTGISFVITTHHPEHALWTDGEVVMMDRNGSVLTAGSVGQCITQENLLSLYDAEVIVTEVANQRCCLPKVDAGIPVA